MAKNIRIAIALVTTAAILVSAIPVVEFSNVDSHLKEFSEYAVLHHDNIDETSEAHSHSHKHSEDGEEHEHDHDHSDVFLTASKLFCASISIKLGLPEKDSKMGFSDTSLISDPHIFGIFRPPKA